MRTYVDNSTKLSLVEVTFTNVGSQRHAVTRNLPVACFEVIDGVAHPVTVVPRVPGAHYYLSDGKVWWGNDGREWASWASLMEPLYRADDKAEPTPEPTGLTVPGVGSVGLAAGALIGEPYGTGQTPIGYRPTSGPRSPSREQAHPRDRSDG